MKFFDRSVTVLLLTFGLGITGAATLPAAPAAGNGGYYQYPAPYTDLRGLIDRTQSDLQAAAEMEHGNDKQRNRYHDAQERLSNLDRNLTKGHFDKGDFDHAIDKIHDILDHNTLRAASRDALMRDITDLKVARDRRW